MYGRQSSVAYEHSPRSKRPNPTTQSSVYREQCALTSTSHTSHRTNLVGGHSKCSSVQTVRIFTSASRHGKWARGEGPHTYIYIYARTYTCTPQDDDDDDDSTRTYRVQHHSRFPWAGAASRLAAANHHQVVHRRFRLAPVSAHERIVSSSCATKLCIGDFASVPKEEEWSGEEEAHPHILYCLFTYRATKRRKQ